MGSCVFQANVRLGSAGSEVLGSVVGRVEPDVPAPTDNESSRLRADDCERQLRRVPFGDFSQQSTYERECAHNAARDTTQWGKGLWKHIACCSRRSPATLSCAPASPISICGWPASSC